MFFGIVYAYVHVCGLGIIFKTKNVLYYFLFRFNLVSMLNVSVNKQCSYQNFERKQCRSKRKKKTKFESLALWLRYIRTTEQTHNLMCVHVCSGKWFHIKCYDEFVRYQNPNQNLSAAESILNFRKQKPILKKKNVFRIFLKFSRSS